MKVRNNLIKASVLLILIFGYQSAEAQQNLAQQAYNIFQQNCLNCHGPHGSYTEQLIIVYFYTLTAGDATATRKMLIRK